MGLLARCEQCGRFHGADEKCRPKWGRRGFLAMLGAIPAMAATGLPAWADPPPPLKKWVSMSVAYTASNLVRLHAYALLDDKWESCTVDLPRVNSLRDHPVRLPIDASGKVLKQWRCVFESNDRPFKCYGINGEVPNKPPIEASDLSFYQDISQAEFPGAGWMYR